MAGNGDARPPPAAAAPAADALSPMALLLHRKHKVLRKRAHKLESIAQLLEERGEAGLEPEQLKSLGDKPVVEGKLALVVELQEQLAALEGEGATNDAEAARAAEAQAAIHAEEIERARAEGEAQAAAAAERRARAEASAATDATREAAEAARAGIEKLVRMLYWGTLFDTSAGDPTVVWARSVERKACISYAAEHADRTGGRAPVSEADLDELARVGRLLTSRPDGLAVSHADAMRRCTELAEALVASRSGGGAQRKGGAKGRRVDGADGAPVDLIALERRVSRVMGMAYSQVEPVMQTGDEAGGSHPTQGAGQGSQAAQRAHHAHAQEEPQQEEEDQQQRQAEQAEQPQHSQQAPPHPQAPQAQSPQPQQQQGILQRWLQEARGAQQAQSTQHAQHAQHAQQMLSQQHAFVPAAQQVQPPRGHVRAPQQPGQPPMQHAQNPHEASSAAASAGPAEGFNFLQDSVIGVEAVAATPPSQRPQRQAGGRANGRDGGRSKGRGRGRGRGVQGGAHA